MFCQLDGRLSLRELTGITTSHLNKSFRLNFGKTTVNKTSMILSSTESSVMLCVFSAILCWSKMTILDFLEHGEETPVDDEK